MLNINYILFMSVLFALQGSISDETDIVEVEATEVELNEILNISNNDIQEKNDLVLGVPFQTLTDQDNNIYTRDPQQNKIFKFDSSGQLINVFGGSGSGPGEFQSITGMLFTNDRQLMVLDFSSRRYTLFNTDGKVDVITSLEHPYASFKPIIYSNYLLLPWIENGKIIHSFDLDQGKITDRFVNIEDILQTEEEFERSLLRQNPGSILALPDDRIVFISTHYNGMMHVYENKDDQWIVSDHISGYRQIQQSFSIHETERQPHSRAQMMFPQGELIVGIELHSWSMGLFGLKDDKFAHVSLTNIGLEGDQMNLIIEIFDSAEGKLEKFTVIDQMSLTARPEQIPVWMDVNGNLYISDMRNEPALRKFELVW